MRKNIDDFYDDAETKSFRFRTFLAKVTLRPKI
jgi:hypothetical protein